MTDEPSVFLPYPPPQPRGPSEAFDFTGPEEGHDMSKLVSIRVDRLVVSRFNSRKSRPKANVERLADRIKRNGFEATRALWVYQELDKYEVFAGGTRLEAARLAGLAEVPCLVHDALTEEEIARLETADNENDEYHSPVPLPDVWAECWRLNREEKWTQQRIAEAKGWSQQVVSKRLRFFETEAIRQPVLDGLFDEGHADEILGVYSTSSELARWLTTEQAQAELVAEVQGKHRGSSTGVKPTVAVVREAAKRWKGFIEAAESALKTFNEADRKTFVAELVKSKARSFPAVEAAKASLLAVIAKRKADAQRRAKAESDEAAAAAALAERQQALVARCQLGDARELVQRCPEGATLLVTDPPYGIKYQGGRPVSSAQKKPIAGDGDLATALDLLQDVVRSALPRMAEDAHVLVFTSWRFEPSSARCSPRSGSRSRARSFG